MNGAGMPGAQFVGAGNTGFLVYPGFSQSYIDREFEKLAENVISEFAVFRNVLGDSRFAEHCASYSISRIKGRTQKEEFLKICQKLLSEFGERLDLMDGKPGYYGVNTAYFHCGEYPEDDDKIRTPHTRYGKFYLPVAAYYPEKRALDYWQNVSVDYGEDKYGYYAYYRHD